MKNSENVVTRYVLRTHIDAVIKKELTVGGRKNADGSAELFTEDAGWYIRIGNLSLGVGNEEPPFKAGQKIKLIIERDS